MKARRVVTGRTPEGKSVFVSDDLVEPVTTQLNPGSELHRLWGSDSLTTLPTDGSQPTYEQFFPPPGGYRFVFFTAPASASGPASDIDLPAALREFEEKLPGLAGHMEPDNPGMHTTNTIDVGVVIAGEIVLELDDGAEVTLKTGDTYVQNGTRHRWHNRGTQNAVVAVAIVGAQPPA